MLKAAIGFFDPSQDVQIAAMRHSHHPGRRLRSCAFPIMMAVGIAAPTAGQEQFTIASEPRCWECKIVLEHVVTLGDASGGVPLGPTSFIRRDSKGNFYTANALDRGVIYIFDSLGRLTKRIGSTKGGDRWFASTVQALLIDDADTLRVFSFNDQYRVI